MAIHYVSDLNHQSLWDKSGHRRSLMIGPSYDANQPLKDEKTKRTIYRPHKDGTEVSYTNIVSADPSCPYGDKSVDSRIRRQNMWNAVMSMATEKSPRCRAFFQYALPNSFSREQAEQCAEAFAMSLSARFHTPVDFSIHYVPSNIHVHIGIPEWTFENGKFASKGKTYYVDQNDQPIKDGVFWTEDGYPLRKPMIDGDKPIILRDENDNPILDKFGHIQYENQIKTKRGERRWHRYNYQNISKEDLPFLHNELDRIVNAEFERIGSTERVTRPNKEVREKLKKAGLVQKHIGPRSCKTKDARFYEITEHNKLSKELENQLTVSTNQINTTKEEISFMDNILKDSAENNAILQELDKPFAEIKMIADYVNNTIKPEQLFISDATEKYNQFVQDKQKLLTPIVQAVESGIDASNNKILEKTPKLDTTAKSFARLKLWHNNIKTLKTFASKLQSYSTKSFVKNIQNIAKRKWNRLKPWAKVKYVESRSNKIDALIYASYLELDIEDPVYDNTSTPKALNVSNTSKWQERAKSAESLYKGFVYNTDFNPSIDTELLSEIVSAESSLTETSFDDNFNDFAKIDFKAPQKEYRATLKSIAEQERIATEEALRKAEEERKAREEALRKAEEQRRLEKLKKQEELRKQQQLAEQQRIAEEKRLAEEKAKQEELQRIAAEKAKQEAEATATRRVADSQAQTQATVVPVLTEAELQEKRQKYDELAKLRDSAKELALQQLATKICDSTYMQDVQKQIDNENYKHAFETDYVLLKYPTVQQEIEKQIQFYRKHTINFSKDCKLHKIAAYNNYKKYADEAQAIRQLIDNTLEAGKEQSKRKKSSTTSKTNTQTKFPKRHIVKVDIDTDRTKE